MINEKLLKPFVEQCVEIKEYIGGNRGHIKFKNGFQIAWVVLENQTCGGTAWTGTNMYYSDHNMGNWSSPFSELYSLQSDISGLQYWAGHGAQNDTSAGVVRAYRPNNTTGSATIRIVAIGKAKN